MICKLLGTGSAEGIPALFCRCDICREAIELGGRNIRGRSCMKINDSILIDFPPDMLSYKVRYGLDLAAISHIFFTHSHLDHLTAGELCYYHSSYADRQSPDSILNVYGNSKVLEVVTSAFYFDMHHMPDCVALHPLKAFSTVETDGVRVTPLPAEHDSNEECFYYLLQQQSSAVLLANDSAELLDEVYRYLADVRLDAVILDCTGGKLTPRAWPHMCFADNLAVMARLKEQGSADNDTTFISHHFSHNGLVNYDDFAKLAGNSGFVSSYDGMELLL
ncbi:MAG: MBL fold metallo-hydrolase [Oscillospiraceae bacterium]|nr:MBL fold metallo-hydrolase [Oscillospiraceae bacterium]MCL2278614.1 MBL fold metallo-hydrolase [Oscillospiraceae bacterium]